MKYVQDLYTLNYKTWIEITKQQICEDVLGLKDSILLRNKLLLICKFSVILIKIPAGCWQISLTDSKIYVEKQVNKKWIDKNYFETAEQIWKIHTSQFEYLLERYSNQNSEVLVKGQIWRLIDGLEYTN